MRARLIAFYLPQYHPIPENDAWWEPGFTEWTNVTKARPLYPGHVQPRLPSELGFYDLRVPETRRAQAELARTYGVEAFCYWHYWFAGRRLLDRPFREVLQSGEPDFPFCLAWANQTWTGVWHGDPNRVLVEQTYPGPADEEAHFAELLPAFRDRRYLTVDGKPLFIVYRPEELPQARRFADHFRELATRAGLPGLYLVGQAPEAWVPTEHNFDASILCEPGMTLVRMQRLPPSLLDRASDKLFGRRTRALVKETLDWPDVHSYETVVQHALPYEPLPYPNHPCVVPNWDNTPRSGTRGFVFHGATPSLFARVLERAVASVEDRPRERRLVFLKSWNEWAEGNYVEPDREFGRGWLETIQRINSP